jgi:tetratricopeptide (TPR) repeat protein
MATLSLSKRRSSHWSHPATLLIAQGELTQAQTVLRESPVTTAAQAPASEQTGSQRLVLCAQAEWLLAQGDVQGALAQIDGLVAVAPYTGEGAVIPRLWHLRGLAFVQQKQYVEAERVLNKGIEAAQRQSLLPLLWRLQVSLGQLYHMQRKADLAQRIFDVARTLLIHLAADLPDHSLGESLLQRFAALLPDTPKPTPPCALPNKPLTA